jgi:hypothetical protein
VTQKKKETIKNNKIMIHLKKSLLTLVALFAISTGAWAEDLYEEFTTNTGASVYTGEHFKITPYALGVGGNDGFCIEYNFPATIEALNGEKITKVEFTGNDIEDLRSDGVTVTYNGNVATVSDVNATSLTIYAVNYIYIRAVKVYYTAPAPAGIDLTPDATRKIWTLDAMPAGNVELQVEYYPGMLIKPTNLVGGTLSVEGLGLGTTSFTAPSEWDHNSTRLTSSHFEGFKSVTEEEAKAWPGVPATGKVALFYNYDETEQKWDMIYFKDGAFDQIHKGQYQQLATIYNLLDFNFSVFYTTGMQMPAGFEKDDDGNIYVKKDTKFTVIAKPAEGYHLVSWSDDAENKELEREFTMTDDDFTVTATFSDEYDLAFEAANANTIEAGKATVKVGDAAATVTEGKLQGVKMGSKVTITAKEGYKFRKVEAKKGGAATLATALENGATVVIAFKYRDDGTCTFTNNNGTFTFVSGTGQLGGGNGPKQLSVENGKLIFKGSGTNSFTDRWSWYGFQVTFDPTANTYEVWKGSDLDVASFTSISVNGTDITDQLSELK